MFAKSNLSKMLRRLAPQQGDGAATTPSDMIMRLRQMMGGQPRSAEVDPGINIPSPPMGYRGNFGRPMQPPMAYRGGSSNFNESTGVYTPDAQGIGGMLSRFAQQFRNAETMPNTRPGILGGMQPRQLTPEEAMAITSMPRVSKPYVDNRGNTHYPDGSVMADAPGTVPPWAIPPQPQVMQPIREVPEQRPSTVYYDPSGPVMPPRPAGGLTLSMPQDPGFNINTATNTFFKTLGDRVASGQMTLDQARAAQAEMRALQLNPAMANRAAATEIAQRNLQVGPYAPRPAQGVGMPMQAPVMPTLPPPPMPVRSDMPAPRGLTLSNAPMQGAAPQPMSAPQGMAMGGLMDKYYGGEC